MEYRSQEFGRDSLQTSSIVLLVLEDAKGNVRLLVNPELSNLMKGRDFFYLQSLLEDFPERAKRDPAALFKQLSSLGVGPLVTRETGNSISDNPALLKLCSSFVQL